MEKIYNFVIDILNKAIKLALTFLCLGVVIQLLIDDKLFNWDPIVWGCAILIVMLRKIKKLIK